MNHVCVNNLAEAKTKMWVLSAKEDRKRTATIKIENKSYPFVSRYSVQEGDLAVIGGSFPYQLAAYVDLHPTSGAAGTVTNVEQSITINHAKATELAFVFTESADADNIKACVKCMRLEANEKTLQNGGKQTSAIMPTTFLIRRLLAALSILSFPEYSKTAVQEEANAILNTKQVFEEGVFWCNFAGYTFSDIHMEDTYYTGSAALLEELKNSKKVRGLTTGSYTNQIAIKGERSSAKPSGSLALKAYVDHVVNLGVVSVLKRCGCNNLLETYRRHKKDIYPDVQDLLDSEL